MKNKLKYLTAVILLAVFTACASISVSAAGGSLDDATYATVATDNQTEDISTVTDGTPSEEEKASEHTDTDENFFTAAYKEISSYASEILCTLTFIGSLVLAIAYKKGLLPLLERSLVTIGNAVGKIKESAKEGLDKGEALGVSIEKKLGLTENMLSDIATRVEIMRHALDESLENKVQADLDKKQMLIVMRAQIDMLYDVFMCSAIPQYQKDAIGEKIAAMKGALAENDGEK